MVTFNLIDTPDFDSMIDIYSQIAVILKAAVSLHSIHLVLFTTANDPFTEHIQFVLKA